MRKRWFILVGAAIGAAGLVAAWPTPPPSGGIRGIPRGGALWLATYNLNFERPDFGTVSAVAALDADLIFLQETHPQWASMLADRLGDAYPFRRFVDDAAAGGLGVLSRYPVDSLEISAPQQAKFPAACMRFTTPLGEFSVLHLHLLPPLSESGSLLRGYFSTPPQRLRELEEHLRCGDGRFDVVLGDLNEGAGPTTEHLAASGFLEAQRAFGPVEPTWSWELPLGVIRGRPDHIFVAEGLEVAAVQVVLSKGASDHHPLVAQVFR